MPIKIRAATDADLGRIGAVRHGTVENRLTDLALVRDEEVNWYLRSAIFLVSEEGAPYAVALDRSSGALLWRSAPFTTQAGTSVQGYYTNASPTASA